MKNLRLTLVASPIITGVVIGLCSLTQWGAKHFFGIDLPIQNQLDIVRSRIGFNREFLLLAAQILIVAPVFEEILFRLVLFKLPVSLLRLKKAFGIAIVAMLSAAIFSAAHYPDWRAIAETHSMVWLPLSNAFLALFAFGLAQCWLYRKTTWLWSPMLAHFTFNLINLVLLVTLPAEYFS